LGLAEREANMVAQAYCFKCRSKVDVQDPTVVLLKSNRPATKGTCPRCGTVVFRIGKARDSDGETDQGWLAQS